MICQHQDHWSDRFSMRSCPESAYILAFFAPPPPFSDENPVMLHFFAYAEIIFAHILVFPACAIEVQHTNENSPTTLHVHYAFLYISLPSLHEYNMKLTLSFPDLWCSPLEFNSKKICQHSTKKKDGISAIKTLFTWSGGPPSSGVGFFCFVSHRA